MDMLPLLASVPIFRGLDERLLRQLAQQLKEATYPAGATVFLENVAADSFFIVESGEVVIAKQLGPDREKTLALIGPGGVFGEMAFFSDSPRTANARTRAETKLWKIERGDFIAFVSQQPLAGLKVLSGLLQVTMDRLEHTSRELATVYQTGKIISSGTKLDDIVKNVQEEITLAVPGAEKIATFLYNEFNLEYDPVTAPGVSGEIPEKHPMVLALLEKERGVLAHGPEDRDLPRVDFLKGARSLLVVPILKNKQLSGFMALWNTARDDAFTSSHLLLVSTVTSQLADAIENIRHRQEEQDRRRLDDAKHKYW